MKPCPFCAEMIQDAALKCRYCGEFLDGSGQGAGGRVGMGFFGYEYKSAASIGRWPLVHIAHGVDPRTGLPRVAKGVIAIGNIALGGIAIGGVAVGGLAIGGLGLGILTLAGVALGVAACGGIAVAVKVAVGGLAISAEYAIGGAAVGRYVISGARMDPEAVRALTDWLDRLR